MEVSTFAGATRTWVAGRPVPVGPILSSLRRGSGDPTYALHDGHIWRAMRTPIGPATLVLPASAPGGRVAAQAWGPGAGWALDRVPRMLGDADDVDGFAPRHDVLADAWRRFEFVRVPATGLVFEALLPAILEQKVTGHEAWYAWRRLVREHGEPAPGPGESLRLAVPPAAETVRRIPSWTWRQLCVDHARSRAIVTVAQRADALERTLDASADAAETALRSLPGIGVWTAAEVRQRAHGDRDAVSFGDYHLSARVGTVLTGRPVDDATMAEVLEAYRPHRYRVQRLVELAGPMPQRRHPRMPPRRHLPTPGSPGGR
ncbi:DNA-3-methyladenine glycosylase family protein [Solicola gregarius]|uniref:DNA-3-methyladenine glycosylase II n=1 Tax=Solicola gregarius TaxID=2908642 RepID=A0AA46YJR8_9ACTN|nr:DNA-3-methyladenine glycosylase 2 family protein [Solicola gregarius]UYM04875.1 DNA-3-methyladenine glycosylase 2 family protein [Solicola gregarius]